jgi:hypothetical protein
VLQVANIAFYVEGNATSFGEEDRSVGAAASGAKPRGREGGRWVDWKVEEAHNADTYYNAAGRIP